MEDQILELLAQGLGKEDTLKTVGCSVEQFEAILSIDGFTGKLMERAKEVMTERVDYRYTKIEDKVLKHIESHIDEYDPTGLCKILETVSRQRLAKSNGAGHYMNPTARHDIILILPTNMQTEKVITNDKNEVVAIGNRNMSALPIDGVRKLFANFANRNNSINEGNTYEAASVA